MGRWQPDSRGRLYEAALDLFERQGFDQTTAAQIAAQAGVTERTFFRQFSDKREVLFGGSAVLGARLVAAVLDAPPDDPPLAEVARGLAAAVAMIGASRKDFVRRRQAVIEANPELRERDRSKMADYAAAIGAALETRGVTRLPANLAAQMGVAVFRVAFALWTAEDDRDLATIVRDAFAELRVVTDADLEDLFLAPPSPD